jgi:hypothetical protein
MTEVYQVRVTEGYWYRCTYTTTAQKRPGDTVWKGVPIRRTI